jgi:hypothetical protein
MRGATLIMKHENNSKDMGANFGFENTKIIFGFRIYGFWNLRILEFTVSHIFTILQVASNGQDLL